MAPGARTKFVKGPSVGIHPDMIEYGTSKAAVWDCPATVMLRFPETSGLARLDDLAETVCRWEEVRERGLMPDGFARRPRPFKAEAGTRDRQVSSYDIFAQRPNNYHPDVEFFHQDRYPQVYGEFVWTGFDYLGEPDPHGETARSSYYGVCCGRLQRRPDGHERPSSEKALQQPRSNSRGLSPSHGKSPPLAASWVVQSNMFIW